MDTNTAQQIETPEIPFPKTRKEGWKRILQIAWPLIVANSFWNLQLTIDRVFLGNFSTEALGAAIAVMGVFWTPMALLQQTAAYVMTFVAQCYGAKENKMIGHSVWQALYLSLFGGLLFLLLMPLAGPLFDFIGHDPSVRKLETEYFISLCFSALPAALIAVASGFYTGLGHTKIIIAINAAGLVANVILDYIMIFGKFGFPAMGIAGAGYATSLANWASAILGLYLMFGRENEKTYSIRSGWKFDLGLSKRFIKYGIPSGLQWALEGLAFTVFLIFVGRMSNGSAALAASGIVVTVMMLAVLPAMGIAQAASVLVGQHLGENRPDHAEASVWSGFQVALMYIMTAALSFVLIPDFYLGWFHNPENAALWGQVSELSKWLLLFVAVFVCFDSMNLVFSFALKGAGDTRWVTTVALILPWPLMVLPTYFMKDWPNAIYWAWASALLFGCTQALTFLMRFRGGKWKSMSVIH